MKSLTLMFFCLIGIVHGQTRPEAVAELPGGNLPIQRIGVNDLVAIYVYDAPEFSRTVRVDAGGFIRLPILNRRLKAAGLMPADLENSLASSLQAAELIVDPFVTVTVAEYNSRPINVMGAVRRPLTFQAVGEVTLLDALARAEGLSSSAGSEVLLSKTQVNKTGERTALTKRISIKALLDRADPELNVKLTGGEEIRVPEAGRIFVVGNVKKPGAFILQEDAGSTILKALALAEGLLPYAGRQAYVYRREAGPGPNNEIPIELRKIIDRKSPDIPLKENDILYIPDAKGTRAAWSAIEKVILFGSGATSAMIYAGVR